MQLLKHWLNSPETQLDHTVWEFIWWWHSTLNWAGILDVSVCENVFSLFTFKDTQATGNLNTTRVQTSKTQLSKTLCFPWNNSISGNLRCSGKCRLSWTQHTGCAAPSALTSTLSTNPQSTLDPYNLTCCHPLPKSRIYGSELAKWADYYWNDFIEWCVLDAWRNMRRWVFGTLLRSQRGWYIST